MQLMNPNNYIEFMYELGGSEALDSIKKALEEFTTFPSTSMKGKYYRTAGDLFFKVVKVDFADKSIEIIAFIDDDTFDGTFYDSNIKEKEFNEFEPFEITEEEYLIILNNRISEI